MTPSIVLNEKVQQTLVIAGSNLAEYQSCIFTHRNVTETPISRINSTHISCRMPVLQMTLKEPRLVNIALKIDEDNIWPVPQPVQYINQLEIADYSLTEKALVLELNSFVTAILGLSYFCVLQVPNG